MGHERVGTLPKSKQWRQIVSGVTASHANPTLVESIASDTAGLVKGQLKSAENDQSVREAFAFLVRFATALRAGSTAQVIGQQTDDPSTFAVAMALRRHLSSVSGDPERSVIATDAAIDALGKWHRTELTNATGGLFEEENLKGSSWQRLSEGEGFSELSRLYFASFAERYLCFYLERELGRTVPNLAARQAFKGEIARHAFESAKITQSFSAAWFKKHQDRGGPSSREISGFVSHALGKMRDELNRGGGSA